MMLKYIVKTNMSLMVAQTKEIMHIKLTGEKNA
jgi:hypothetical protein